MLEKIALQKNLITKDQCEKAEAACKTSKNYESSLKNYFLSKGLISAREMKRLITTFHALKIMRKNAMFGTIAVKLGFVGGERFQEEMGRQKQAASGQSAPQFIGEIWLKNGTLSKQQFLKILQIQKKRPGPPSLPTNGDVVEAKIRSGQQTPQAKGESKDKQDKASEKTVPQEPVSETETPKGRACKKEISGGMVLEIDDTAMNAFVYKSDRFDDNLTTDELLEILAENNIFAGIADHSQLAGFIKSSGFRRKPFKVATGTEKKEGKDARIEYYFDTDHLKAGGLDEGGNIDFKDRGEIPWVERGTLLAEKFPMEEARNGRNIFDEIVEVPPVADYELRCKAGALISEDESRVYAEISGHPRLSWAGNIHVSDTFVVEEDVNYQTGHVAYTGNVLVKGSLKSGFRIQGDDVRVNVVDGGHIHAEGDVTVLNGVNDAVIYARGNVSAKFIHNAKIFCLGNVTVAKEIVDSTIQNSGALLITSGEIISSEITSNMGIQVRHLGTDKSVPNTIHIGKDAFTENEIKVIQKKIVKAEAKIEKLREKRDALQRDIKGFHEATARLAHELDRARDDGRHLSVKMGAEEQNAGLKSQYQKNRALFSRLDDDLNRYFDRIEKNESRLEDIEVLEEELEDMLDDLQYELINFTEWQASNPSSPVVVVSGKVCAGTLVHGCHSHKEIKDQISNVKIREIQQSDEGGYEIQVHDNFKR